MTQSSRMQSSKAVSIKAVVLNPLAAVRHKVAFRPINLRIAEPEAGFEDVMRIAAHISEMEMAVVSLVKGRQSWAAASTGVEGFELRGPMSFVDHTVSNANMVVVHDALLDPRFAEDPLVLGEPWIRSYVGFPLVAKGGVVGALSVLDRAPRALDSTRIELLAALSRQVTRQLVLHGRTVALAAQVGHQRVAPVEPAQSGPTQRDQYGSDLVNQTSQRRLLAHEEAQWRATFDGAPIAMVKLDSDGIVLAANRALADLLERPVEELVGTCLIDHVAPIDRSSVPLSGASTPRESMWSNGNEHALVTASGRIRWVSVYAAQLDGINSGLDATLLHLADVTDAKRNREQIEAVHARYAALVENSSDAITVTRPDGIVNYASPALQHLLGLGSNEITGSRLRDRVHPDDRAKVSAVIARVIEQPHSPISYECRIQRGDLTWRHVEVTLANRLSDPSVGGFVANIRDISERVRAAKRLAHQAMHDTLTDLPNRALLLDRLDQALARARRTNRQCAVLFLDLDGFKDVNDNMGHAAGDRLLTEVARRLMRAVRPGDSVARLGGDEFVVLTENIETGETAFAIAERVRTAVAEPVLVGGRLVAISTSIGIAFSDQHTASTLLQEADTALYQAKHAGRDRWEVYDQAMRLQAQRRFELEDVLRAAVDGPVLELDYQPIVDITAQRVIGCEALSRIRTADDELIPPAEFIGIAEQSGLIVALGAAVLRHACSHQAAWNAARLVPSHVAVNVSARQLASSAIVDHVTEALESAGLPPEMLCLELTETALIDAGSSTSRRLHELKALGVRIALDDFGTGWSSLAYLRRFPIDVVKIDREFISGLGESHDDAELVRAIVSLGQALGLEVIAEGVESRAQTDMLVELGCNLIQGFRFSKPQPASTFAEAVSKAEKILVSSI